MPIRPRVVATLAAAACLASIAVAPAASAHTTRGRVNLHTTSHRTVVAPAHTNPGLVELHNSGKHAVMVVSGPAHHAAQLAATSKHHGMAAFNAHFAIRGEIAAHRSIYLQLHGGALYLIDTTRTHVPTAASMREVDVTGRTRNAVLPASRPLIVRTGPQLSVTRTMVYGSLLHVTNSSHRMQFIEFVRIGSHTSDAQLAAFVAHPSDLFDLDIVAFPDFVLLSAHRSEWTTVHAPRGRYLVLASGLSGTHGKPAVAALTVK